MDKTFPNPQERKFSRYNVNMQKCTVSEKKMKKTIKFTTAHEKTNLPQNKFNLVGKRLFF
jgi:hypothetical protein